MINIDLRSDTVTKPTKEMLKAMYEAELGDDDLDGDPTTIKLQEMASSLIGKEESLLVSSGSMGNLVSALSQVKPNETMIIGNKSHMSWSTEQGNGHPTYGQIDLNFLNETNGFFDLNDINNSLNSKSKQVKLVCIENTHNADNGIPIRYEYIKDLSDICNKSNSNLHIDGARIFNAASALNISVDKLVDKAQSVSFCLSKGLACPIGSIISGSKEFIYEARKQRKIIGGVMRQTGIISAAGIVALKTMPDRMIEDHITAKNLANGLAQIKGININPENVHTNIVFFSTNNMDIDELQQKLDSNGIRCFNLNGRIRMVTHYEINLENIDTALNIISKIMN